MEFNGQQRAWGAVQAEAESLARGAAAGEDRNASAGAPESGRLRPESRRVLQRAGEGLAGRNWVGAQHGGIKGGAPGSGRQWGARGERGPGGAVQAEAEGP